VLSGAQHGQSVSLQADGKIVVAGTLSYYDTNGTFQSEFAVARFLPDEGPDSNQLFVAQVYQDILHRAVDSSGLAFWSNVLDKGAATRTQVASVIESSTEYRTNLIDQVYGSLLGRPADPAGKEAFLAFLQSGGTVLQMKAVILGSPEYFQRAGATNNAFLSKLYHDVLNRDVDPSGTQTFGTALAHGAARALVAMSVMSSPEGAQDAVQSLYQRVLRRAADPVGLDAFTKALQNGASEEAVMAVMIGSQEYFTKL